MVIAAGAGAWHGGASGPLPGDIDMDAVCSDNLLGWQARLVPIVYDALFHHNLHWPTQACRWGERVEAGEQKDRYRVFFSEQPNGTEPPKLVAADVDVVKPGICGPDVVSAWQEQAACPYLQPQCVVLHPGDVSKIRELPTAPSVLVTHTDSPDVFVWNMATQPDRAGDKPAARNVPSTADLRLTGHTEEALFPLAASAVAPVVASGGGDHMVLVWNLQDSMESILGGGGGGPGTCPELSPRVRFAGHAYTVEDVVFKPDSCNVLASVGDDHMIAFWDVRTPRAPTSCVCDAHGRNQDIQVVDWCGLDGLSVATGAMDGSLKVWDVRRMSRPCDAVAAFSGQHAGGIIRIEWHPQERGVLASGGEDRLVNVWRVPTATQPAPNGSGGGRGGRGGAAGCGGAALLFQHIGHHRGKVMDFQWCNGEGDAASWTMLSASDDADDEDISGGSLQVWRMSPLIHLHEDAAVELLRPHQDFILGQSAGSGDGDDGGGPGAAASEHPAQPSVKQEDSSSLRRMATAAAETGRPGGSNAASEGSGAGAGAGGGQTERLPLVRSSGPLRARVGGADPRDETCMHDS